MGAKSFDGTKNISLIYSLGTHKGFYFWCSTSQSRYQLTVSRVKAYVWRLGFSKLLFSSFILENKMMTFLRSGLTRLKADGTLDTSVIDQIIMF